MRPGRPYSRPGAARATTVGPPPPGLPRHSQPEPNPPAGPGAQCQREQARSTAWMPCPPPVTGSGRPGTGLRHRTPLLTRPGPVPPARALRLWAGWAYPTLLYLHWSAGQPRSARAMGVTRAAHDVLDRRSRIAAGIAVLAAVVDRATARTTGPGLPCVDRRGLRHSGDGGLNLLAPAP